MSTLAVETAGPLAESSPSGFVKLADLVVLGIAIPVFIVGGFPILGLVVAAALWLAQRAVQFAALRHIRTAGPETTRSRAMGIIAATMLGRVWTMALVILILGLNDREAGLAAAVLSAALFTAYLAGEGISTLSERREDAR